MLIKAGELNACQRDTVPRCFFVFTYSYRLFVFTSFLLYNRLFYHRLKSAMQQMPPVLVYIIYSLSLGNQ